MPGERAAIGGNHRGPAGDYSDVHSPERPTREGGSSMKTLDIVARRKKTRSRLLNNHG
ncbi:hypothetical protein [Streptosporangium saharense]|uniref:hypothetical protein n=1 Tax=Streptosporangium saharense TaxID=1706840 RepID=UPI00342090F9